MPAVAIEENTPLQPKGMKPPASSWLKFTPWKTVTMNDTITTTIIASFHHTIALLRRANQRIPTTLMRLKSASIAAATANPAPVRTGTPLSSLCSQGR